jgi:hypothetical protein
VTPALYQDKANSLFREVMPFATLTDTLSLQYTGSDRRITFSRGNFIEHNKGTARIDNIMVHEFLGTRRLFATVSDIQNTFSRDYLLDLPLMELSGTTRILGLPAISPQKLYIMDLDERLVWVDWTLQFL